MSRSDTKMNKSGDCIISLFVSDNLLLRIWEKRNYIEKKYVRRFFRWREIYYNKPYWIERRISYNFHSIAPVSVEVDGLVEEIDCSKAIVDEIITLLTKTKFRELCQDITRKNAIREAGILGTPLIDVKIIDPRYEMECSSQLLCDEEDNKRIKVLLYEINRLTDLAKQANQTHGQNAIDDRVRMIESIRAV